MEEKDVQRLLDMLYSMIDEAKSAAFSSDKCVISRDEALDLLDDIRAKLPLEIKKAQELVRAREEYVSSAKKEVEKMLRQAELDAKVIVSESETLQQARRKSSEIIRRAEERSKELYHVANTYTEDALRRTEEAIQAALDEVKESRVRFRATSNEQMQANQEKLRERTAQVDTLTLSANITQEGTGESLSLLSFAEENGRISCSNKKWRVLYIVPAIFASFGTETNVLENGENAGNNEKNHGFCLQKPGKWYLQSAEKSCILNVAVGNYGAFTHDCGAKAHKVEDHSLKWGSCPQR